MVNRMSVEEFKEEVFKHLMEHERKGADEGYLRGCVNDEYFESDIMDGYRRGLESELGMISGIRYAAHTIDMCI